MYLFETGKEQKIWMMYFWKNHAIKMFFLILLRRQKDISKTLFENFMAFESPFLSRIFQYVAFQKISSI